MGVKEGRSCRGCIGRYNVRAESGSGSVVEHLLAKEGVAGSNPVFRSIFLLEVRAEVAELVDAADSKSAEGQPSCRFESGLRHHAIDNECGVV